MQLLTFMFRALLSASTPTYFAKHVDKEVVSNARLTPMYLEMYSFTYITDMIDFFDDQADSLLKTAAI